MKAMIVEDFKVIEVDPHRDHYEVMQSYGKSRAFDIGQVMGNAVNVKTDIERVRLRRFRTGAGGEEFKVGFTAKAQKECMDFFTIYDEAFRNCEDVMNDAVALKRAAVDVVIKFKDANLWQRLKMAWKANI